ncbi:unnamed protein product [Caenorhabditis angaria]|uniref:Uncharacterized protein n=1 Tax=Caenorhabditis angaria TaxID=860376 RepID=A0A9P1ILW9_9PELO|nr:unnamed protein product [Caenorhabditis angaria]
MRAALITILFVLAMACIYVAAEGTEATPAANDTPVDGEKATEPPASGNSNSNATETKPEKTETTSAGGILGIASIISMTISYLLVNYI